MRTRSILTTIVLLSILLFGCSKANNVNINIKESEKGTQDEYFVASKPYNVSVEKVEFVITAPETTTEKVTEKTTEVVSEKTTSEQTTKEEETTTLEQVKDQKEEETTVKPIEVDKNNSHLLNVSCILQNPDLPTGCEITSLAIVLNYLGYPVDKCTLSDNYLKKGAVGTVLPTEAFLGNPRDNNSFGCYSPVIVDCANNYLSANNSSLKAIDLSGSSFESLFSELKAGNPIVIWATMDMAEPYYSRTWNINGKNFTWKSKEHCLVLTGYDIEKNIVYVADPLKGNTTYPMNVFKDRYEKMFSQAVVIYKKGRAKIPVFLINIIFLSNVRQRHTNNVNVKEKL